MLKQTIQAIEAICTNNASSLTMLETSDNISFRAKTIDFNTSALLYRLHSSPGKHPQDMITGSFRALAGRFFDNMFAYITWFRHSILLFHTVSTCYLTTCRVIPQSLSSVFHQLHCNRVLKRVPWFDSYDSLPDR